MLKYIFYIYICILLKLLVMLKIFYVNLYLKIEFERGKVNKSHFRKDQIPRKKIKNIKKY